MKRKIGKLIIVISGFVISICGLLNLMILANPTKKVLFIIGPLLIICGMIAIKFGFNLLKGNKNS
ncbi:hypothetical protein [Caldicellulosiruptor naganoensis]|uniref:Uncharacterized protein n=1 Tax=Caldicellulosiruptor naganoensis TaxID=29324 RepID=A0ABY7BJ07_9FIRM|nr:hypothetical protein [Caldicellulosiruptor naganoensis]WAM31710.1 hypothetical protein OTJ99_000147 [Caldicellulosiruptor naganoensis]